MFSKVQFSPNYLLNLVTTFLSQACSAGLIILLTPVLQQRFSIEEFSNYGVLLNIILFTSAFDFGLNLGLMRRLIHERMKASILISSSFFFFLLLFALAFPIFLLLYYKNVLHTSGDFFLNAVLTALLVLQTIVATLFDVILQSTNKIFIGKLIRISKTVVEFFLLLYLSQKGSATILLLASGGLNFLFIAVLFFFSKKEAEYTISYQQFSWYALFEHMQYSFWYFLNSIGVVFVFNSQIIMLNTLATKTEVASYILVSRFLDVVRMGATNFTTILFPSLATLEAKGEWSQLRDHYFTILKRVILFSILMLFFLFTFGKNIFEWWSGQGGDEIVKLYYLCSFFTILIVIDNVSSVFLHAFRLNKVQTLLSIGQGLMALLIGYFLLQQYGLVGMAIGSLIALVSTNFIYNPAFLIAQFRRRVRS
jgi:O-antigen/teichoic acid export membrane protein